MPEMLKWLLLEGVYFLHTSNFSPDTNNVFIAISYLQILVAQETPLHPMVQTSLLSQLPVNLKRIPRLPKLATFVEEG